MTKVIIFTGAGIGPPLNLPITTGFNQIIEKIRNNNPSLKHVFETIGASSNDIEKLLFTLEELNREDNTTLNIIKSVIESNRPEGVKIMQSIAGVKHQIKNAIAAIKKDIFNMLNEFDREASFFLYYNLFKELKQQPPDMKYPFIRQITISPLTMPSINTLINGMPLA